MFKKKENILLFFLFLFSVYSALTIGQSWDEGAQLAIGKVTLDYLFSFGKIERSQAVTQPVLCRRAPHTKSQARLAPG